LVEDTTTVWDVRLELAYLVAFFYVPCDLTPGIFLNVISARSIFNQLKIEVFIPVWLT
jgi:hypothetical protein